MAINSLIHMLKSKPFQKSESLPYIELLILSVLNITNSIATSSIFAYVGFMIFDLGLVSSTNYSGYYSGLICSAIFIGRFFSSYPWGIIGDIYGRKILMMVSCLAIAFFSICAGFSTNIPMIVIMRFLMGLFSCINGVSQTLVTDICDEQHEVYGMGVITSAWNAG